MTIVEFFKIGWKSIKITKTALTGLTVSVDADAETLTRGSGSWIDDGIAVGDWITTTGFDNAANNDTFEVTNVTDTVLTVDDSGDVLVDATDDGSVGVDPATKRVYNGRCLLGRIRVNTDAITVTPKDDTTEKWGTIIDDSEFDVGFTPMLIMTELATTFSDDGSAWFFYKPVD